MEQYSPLSGSVFRPGPVNVLLVNPETRADPRTAFPELEEVESDIPMQAAFRFHVVSHQVREVAQALARYEPRILHLNFRTPLDKDLVVPDIDPGSLDDREWLELLSRQRDLDLVIVDDYLRLFLLLDLGVVTENLLQTRGSRIASSLKDFFYVFYMGLAHGESVKEAHARASGTTRAHVSLLESTDRPFGPAILKDTTHEGKLQASLGLADDQLTKGQHRRANENVTSELLAAAPIESPAGHLKAAGLHSPSVRLARTIQEATNLRKRLRASQEWVLALTVYLEQFRVARTIRIVTGLRHILHHLTCALKVSDWTDRLPENPNLRRHVEILQSNIFTRCLRDSYEEVLTMEMSLNGPDGELVFVPLEMKMLADIGPPKSSLSVLEDSQGIRRSFFLRDIRSLVSRLKVEETLLARGDMVEHFSRLTSEGWRVYKSIWDVLTTFNGYVTLHILRVWLAESAPSEAWLKRAWQSFKIECEYNASESIVLAMLYKIHLEVWNPNAGMLPYEDAELNATQIARSRAMAMWVPCYCSTSQCNLEWNFANNNFGLHRGQPGPNCDALQFHQPDGDYDLLPSEEGRERTFEAHRGSERVRGLERSRLNSFAHWINDGKEASLTYERRHNVNNLASASTDSGTPLHRAAREGACDEIEKLISSASWSADMKDHLGRTPLHNAAHMGHIPAFELLVDSGATIEEVDLQKRTPLHEAACAGQLEVVERLIQYGADVDAKDSDGRTALHHAIRERRQAIIMVLIHHGARTDLIDDLGCGLLDYAVMENDAGLVCLFSSLGDANGERTGIDLAKLPASASIPDLTFRGRTALMTQPHDIVQNTNLSWNGLRTFKDNDNTFDDVFVVCGTVPINHRFSADTLSEQVQRLFPSFGLELLTWLSATCQAATSLDPISRFSHYTTPATNVRIPSSFSKSHASSCGPEESALSSSERVSVVGRVDDGKIALVLSAESEACLLATRTALAWLLAALAPRPKSCVGTYFVHVDESCLQEGLPRPKPFERPQETGYCWMPIFEYAQILTLPLSPAQHPDIKPEGLQIDFQILVELTGVDRQASLSSGGQLIYGFDTALVPLEPTELRRWHFMRCEDRQFTRSRAERELDRLNVHAAEVRQAPDVVYVGSCPQPKINLFHAPQRPFPRVWPVTQRSDVCIPGRIEESLERSAGNNLSSTFRAGPSGFNFSLTGGGTRDKKYKLINHVAPRSKATYSNYEDILRCADKIPCIIWDNASNSERAWLLPLLFVLAFASLQSVEAEGYSFQRLEADARVSATLSYLDHRDVTVKDVKAMLRRNRDLLVCASANEPVPDSYSFEKILRNIWELMCDGEDLYIDSTTGVNRQVKEGILGYDLSDVACCRNPQLQELAVSRSMKHWYPLCLGSRVHVIFARGIGQALTCGCGTVNDGAACSRPSKAGSLTCLLSDLKDFFGGPGWDQYPYIRSAIRLPILNGFEWIPNGLDYCSDIKRQSITPIPAPEPRRLQKVSSGQASRETSNGLIHSVGTTLMCLTTGERLLCFGDENAIQRK